MERKLKSEGIRILRTSRRTKLLIALLIVAMLVGLSFILGYISSELKISPLTNSLNQDQQTLEALLLTASVNVNSSIACPIMNAGLETVSQELSSLYSEISGAQSGYPLPSQYSSIEYQLAYIRLNYWLLSQKIYYECSQKIVTALMFYPNNVCVSCGEEGQELAVIAQESNYSFVPTVIETGLNINEVYALSEVYNITSYPTLVINGKYIVNGYLTKDQIIAAICTYSPQFNLCG